MSGHSKALHLLGLDAKREVQTLMKDLLESNGPYYPFMASDSYFKVWEGLSKHRAATSVAVELIQRIGQICKDARSKMDGPTAEAALYPLLNTIQVLDMFYDLPNEGDVLARALEGWAKEHAGGDSPPAVAHAAMVLRNVMRRHVLGEGMTLSTLIEAAFVAPSTSPTAPRRMLSGGSPFTILHLRAVLEDGSQLPRVVDGLTGLLAQQHKQLRQAPAVAQSATLALLHLVRALLILRPLPDRAVLSGLADAVRPFAAWPMPYGGEAAHVLALLDAEARAPGATLRADLLARHLMLTPGGEEAALGSGSAFFAFWSSVQRSVLTFTDLALDQGALFRKFFHYPADDATLDEEHHALRLQFLLHALEMEFELPPADGRARRGRRGRGSSSAEDEDEGEEGEDGEGEGEEEEEEDDDDDEEEEEEEEGEMGDPARAPGLPLNLHKHSARSVLIWFARARAVLAHAETLPVDGAARFRSQQLAALAQRIQPGLKLRPREAGARTAAAAAGAGEREGADAGGEEQPVDSSPVATSAAAAGRSLNCQFTPRMREPCMDFLPITEHSAAPRVGSNVGAIRGDNLVCYRHETELFAKLAQAATVVAGLLDRVQRSPDESEMAAATAAVAAGGGEAPKQPRSSATPAERTARAMKSATVPGAGAGSTFAGPLGAVSPANAEALHGPPEVCVCALGGNYVLHRVVCALARVRHTRPADLAALRVRVFVVPLGEGCDVAELLASHDGWYRRHVFLPFLRPSFVPSLDPREAPVGVEASLGANLFEPIALQRSLLRDYFQLAHHTLKVRVFECQCWARNEDRSRSKPATLTVPFCIRLELGVFPTAEAHRRAAGTPRSTPLTSVIADRDFPRRTSATPPIAIDYGEATLRGTVQRRGVKAPASYGLIRLANMPDSRLPPVAEEAAPDPSLPSLDLEMLPRAGAFASLAGRRDHMSVSALRECMQREAERKRVASMSARVADDTGSAGAGAASDATFHILADGELYGPFQSIRIMAVDATQQPHLSVASFFPCQTST